MTYEIPVTLLSPADDAGRCEAWAPAGSSEVVTGLHVSLANAHELRTPPRLIERGGYFHVIAGGIDHGAMLLDDALAKREALR